MIKYWQKEPAVIVGVLTALVNVIVAAGVPMSDQLKVALLAFIPAALALVTRSQVSPAPRPDLPPTEAPASEPASEPAAAGRDAERLTGARTTQPPEREPPMTEIRPAEVLTDPDAISPDFEFEAEDDNPIDDNPVEEDR